MFTDLYNVLFEEEKFFGIKLLKSERFLPTWHLETIEYFSLSSNIFEVIRTKKNVIICTHRVLDFNKKKTITKNLTLQRCVRLWRCFLRNGSFLFYILLEARLHKTHENKGASHMAQWDLFDVVNSVILKFPADDL